MSVCPIFSIVAPAHNAAEYLEACLAVVRLRPVEIIIVDDSSTDETASIARRMGARDDYQGAERLPRELYWFSVKWSAGALR
jgi:glycosyltransferase involved in cell wall biosynthesis